MVANLNTLPEATWIQPIPDGLVAAEGDPAEVAVARETIRLAFVAALQHLPPRQRAVLILCEVLRWKAAEVAELLETSVASVNSALQRARATLEASKVSAADPAPPLDEADASCSRATSRRSSATTWTRSTALIQEDATQSMPPFDLWLSGRDDILTWWFGPGIGCAGSRVIPTWPPTARPRSGSTSRARPATGYEPWALQVLELVRRAGSSSSRSSSTPRRSSRSSGCPPGSTRSTSARPHEREQLPQLARRAGAAADLDAAAAARRAAAARARRPAAASGGERAHVADDLPRTSGGHLRIRRPSRRNSSGIATRPMSFASQAGLASEPIDPKGREAMTSTAAHAGSHCIVLCLGA